MTSTPDVIDTASRVVAEPGTVEDAIALVAADRPVPFVTAPQHGLGIFEAPRGPWIWFVGCHGGAGETTIAELLPGAGAADHRWPVVESVEAPFVVLTARTSASGLLAARTVLTQWAAGATPPVRLLGLVLSADAPGRQPRALRHLADLVAGGVRDRHVWHLPWVDAWRVGDRADRKITARLFADLGRLTETP